MNYDQLINSPQHPTPFPEKKRYMSFIKKLVNNNFHYIKFIIKEIYIYPFCIHVWKRFIWIFSILYMHICTICIIKNFKHLVSH